MHYQHDPQTRSFCYIDALIDGLVRLMGSLDEITGPLNPRLQAAGRLFGVLHLHPRAA
jgi:hypothetical protein